MSPHRTFGDLVLHEDAAVVRVFLPLIDSINEGHMSTWRQACTVGDLQLTAETSWFEAFDWGQGQGEFESPWRPSMGQAPAVTISQIMQLLHEVAGTSDGWQFKYFPEVGTPIMQQDSGARISLQEFTSMWVDSPLPGSLTFKDVVMLSAPPYADSVILSGPRELLALGKELGLEVVAALPEQALPDMQW